MGAALHTQGDVPGAPGVWLEPKPPSHMPLGTSSVWDGPEDSGLKWHHSLQAPLLQHVKDTCPRCNICLMSPFLEMLQPCAVTAPLFPARTSLAVGQRSRPCPRSSLQLQSVAAAPSGRAPGAFIPRLSLIISVTRVKPHVLVEGGVVLSPPWECCPGAWLAWAALSALRQLLRHCQRLLSEVAPGRGCYGCSGAWCG